MDQQVWDSIYLEGYDHPEELDISEFGLRRIIASLESPDPQPILAKWEQFPYTMRYWYEPIEDEL